MKYCAICKINVDKNLDNCPLCGSYLDEKNAPLPYENYEKNIEPYLDYPKIKAKVKVDFWGNRFIKLIMLATLVCVCLDLFIHVDNMRGIQWAHYVIIGSILLSACIIHPIVKKTVLRNQIIVDLPLFIVCAIFMELFITNFASVDIVLKWVIPSFFVAAILMCDALIIAYRKTDAVTGEFSTLLYCTIWVIIYQLIMWIFDGLGQRYSLFIVMVFFASLLNLGFVAILCFKKLRAEYQRKLNL